MRRLLVVFALGASVSTPGTRAWAAEPALALEASEAPSTAEAEARRLFFLGRDAWKAGDFGEACRHFRASQELSSSPATLLNLGKCQEREGDRKGARESYERALHDARTHADPQRSELWTAAARKELDALPEEAADTPAPVAATQAPAVKPPAAAAAAAPRHGVTAARGSGGVVRSAREPSSPNVLPWVFAGGGGLLVGGAVVTGIVSGNARGKLERECTLPASSPDHVGCPPHLADERTRARDFAIATDVLWIAGAASAAVGITLWLTADGSAGEPSSVARFGCHPRGCDASVRAEF
jgi:hypothetical protein